MGIERNVEFAYTLLLGSFKEKNVQAKTCVCHGVCHNTFKSLCERSDSNLQMKNIHVWRQFTWE